MSFRLTQISILFCFGLFLALSSSLWTVVRADSPDPSAILSSPALAECLPDLKDAEDRLVIAFTQSEGKSYYTVLANSDRLKARYSQTDAESEGGLPNSSTPPQESKPIWEVTFSVDAANHCEVLVPRQIEQPRALTELMPEEAARQLTLQKFQFDAGLRGGIDALQAGLDETSSSYRQGGGEGRQLQPYEVWAYEQLGVKVPDTIPVAKPTGPGMVQPPTPDSNSPAPVNLGQ